MDATSNFEPIFVKWDEYLVGECQFCEKKWVMPSDINNELREYQVGSFPRAYCNHDLSWCSAENGSDCCQICQDHENE